MVGVLLQLTQGTLDDLIGENEIARVHAQKIWIFVLELQLSFKQQLEQRVDKKGYQKM